MCWLLFLWTIQIHRCCLVDTLIKSSLLQLLPAPIASEALCSRVLGENEISQKQNLRGHGRMFLSAYEHVRDCQKRGLIFYRKFFVRGVHCHIKHCVSPSLHLTIGKEVLTGSPLLFKTDIINLTQRMIDINKWNFWSQFSSCSLFLYFHSS